MQRPSASRRRRWSARWRLRRDLHTFDEIARKAESGDARSKAIHGSFLARAPSTRPQAMQELRESAMAGDASGMNGYAWYLATAREDHLRDGGEAVRWAEKGYALDPSVEVRDTLAAAYAEVDRWDDAIATQKRVVQSPGLEATAAAEYMRHLEHFERHEKLRE